MNELYKLILNVQEIVKANNMFLQSFEQRIAAMEQKIAAMEKTWCSKYPTPSLTLPARKKIRCSRG